MQSTTAPDHLDSDAYAVQIEGLTKRYGKMTAVNNASFVVKPGDVFGLLGPNGAGKTTIIRMMVGLVKQTAGQIRVFGSDPLIDRRAVLQHTSTILEAPAMYPKLNAFDNLRALGLLVGLDDPRKIHEVLETIHLLDRANDKFETYSLGMKQRLCIAASLLTDPDLIILDEPTNGLDPAGMYDIRELIRNLALQGHTVLLSSHLLNEVEQVCNRVAILQRGTMIVQGSVDELLAGKSLIRVKVQPDEIDRAQQVLETNGWAGMVSHDAGYVVVRGMISQGRAINQALFANNIVAGEIVHDKMSLEEYYLSLTSGSASNRPASIPTPDPIQATLQSLAESATEAFHDSQTR